MPKTHRIGKRCPLPRRYRLISPRQPRTVSFGGATTAFSLTIGGQSTPSFTSNTTASQLADSLNNLSVSTPAGRFSVVKEATGDLVVIFNGDLAHRNHELRLVAASPGATTARLEFRSLPVHGTDWLIDTVQLGLNAFFTSPLQLPTVQQLSRSDGDRFPNSDGDVRIQKLHQTGRAIDLWLPDSMATAPKKLAIVDAFQDVHFWLATI